MADKKISQLTTLAQADVAVTADFLPIVDTSATETKKATPQSVVLGALGATSANVGIGTASPDQRLVVNGIIQSGTTGSNGNLYLGGLNVSLRSSYATNDLGMYTNNAERLRIDSVGDVGIGTNLPRGNLDVGTGTAISITRSIHLGFSTANFYGYRLANTNDASVTYAGTLAIQRGNGSAWVDNFTVDDNANVTAGGGTLATNAVNGFLYVPTCAGTPTGTPTAKTGYAPVVVDTTNNKLYFYSGGAWRDAGP